MTTPRTRFGSLLMLILLASLSLTSRRALAIEVSGQLQTWHKVTLTVAGPQASELDSEPNPFTDYRLTATFTAPDGKTTYVVPGYFAADGNAGETSATAGNKWRVHFAADQPGEWHVGLSMVRGAEVALDRELTGEQVAGVDGQTTSLEIGPSDRTGRDFRAHGRLQYVGQRYLQFAGTKRPFVKAGADSPETLLAYEDFDGTTTGKAPLKTWQAHVRDWREGDPTWQNGKGKGLIGAINYLAGKGANAISFLPYNAGGDGDNVWPFVARNDRLHYDCSKLDQWQQVFDHAQANGMYLHFKLQETEIDDQRKGDRGRPVSVPTALDGGACGPERKLYLRELVARFAYELALNWNLGEENTQTPAEQIAMAEYLREIDPYDHHLVIHTFPSQQDRVYQRLIGDQSPLTGVSLQNEWSQVHRLTEKWLRLSADAGKQWVVANDEQGNADSGTPPDATWPRNANQQEPDRAASTDDIRKFTLWGNLMAGGAGVELYFGYKHPENDLNCQDWRSRDQMWDYCRHALEFFNSADLPLTELRESDALVGNPEHKNAEFCLAKPGELYVIYLPKGGVHSLDLSGASGDYTVTWYNPRSGGEMQAGSVTKVSGGRQAELGGAPADPQEDWVVVVRN